MQLFHAGRGSPNRQLLGELLRKPFCGSSANDGHTPRSQHAHYFFDGQFRQIAVGNLRREQQINHVVCVREWIQSALLDNHAINAETCIGCDLTHLGDGRGIRITNVDQEVARTNELERCLFIKAQNRTNTAVDTGLVDHLLDGNRRI